MSAPWGPQQTGGIEMPRKRREGPWWSLFFLASLVFMPLLWVSRRILSSDSCKPAFYPDFYERTGTQCPYTPDTSSTVADINTLLTVIWWMTLVVGVLMGFWDAHRHEKFARGHYILFVLLLVLQRQAMIGYAAAFVATKLIKWVWALVTGTGRGVARTAHKRQANDAKLLTRAADPYGAVLSIASRQFGSPGAHLGWDGLGSYIGVAPERAVLIIGPPRSGKTASQIIPSVLVAPYATVASSVRDDVMAATVATRRLVGRVWHFDPGGVGTSLPEVIQARWSPIVGLRTWDDARMKANRLAEATRKPGSAQGSDGDHFIDRARDWIEVLLYAAALDNQPISVVADWATRPDNEEVMTQVDTILLYAKKYGDQGAGIALAQHAGLQEIPERERGSIKSTITRILRIYGSQTAREVGYMPNFDPRAFVRSSDTLYITAPADRQQEYAPLLAGLLQEIRYATYERHRAEGEGWEPKRPHVTFALDEANNTAPIPLPEIVSEAGGQGLHVIVGIQDLSRARNRWGREAEGFLTLFSVKVVHDGVVEQYTLDALSMASGEYDRVMQGFSESTSYTPGPHPHEVTHINPSYSITSRRVLLQGDIAQLPPGTALLFVGAQHQLINIGMYFAAPTWQAVMNYTSQQPAIPRPEVMPISVSGAPFSLEGNHPVIDGQILPPTHQLPGKQ